MAGRARWHQFDQADRFVVIAGRESLVYRDIVRRRQRQPVCNKPALRLPVVGAVRITLEIVPIGLRRSDRPRPTPQDVLPPPVDDLPDLPCQRVSRMMLDEPLIGFERILFDGDAIGLVGRHPTHVNFGHPARAAFGHRYSGHAQRRRQGLGLRRDRRDGRCGCRDCGIRRGRGFEQFDLDVERADHVRDLGAARGLIDLQADAPEDLLDFKTGLAHQRRKRGGIGAVGSGSVGREGARRCRIPDQHARWRADQRKTGRRRLPGCAAEAMIARRVEHHNARRRRQRRERIEHRRQRQRFALHRLGGIDLGIDRNEEVLGVQLHAMSGVIEEYDRVRTRGGNLVEQCADRRADVGLGHVPGLDDVVARRLQGFDDKASIRGGGRERRRTLIRAVGDHQCDARLR